MILGGSGDGVCAHRVLDGPLDLGGRERQALDLGDRLREWGLWSSGNGQGGGDNPTYITGMLTWATNHNLAWTSYFNSSEGQVDTTLQANPNSLQAFRNFLNR